MMGEAFCHGAATIVNAIGIRKGSAFGIKLKTTAKVKLTNEPGKFITIIKNEPSEKPILAEFCVKNVLKKFGLENEYGATITTESDIPISRGLKSSSAAANAIVSATLEALGETLDDMEIIDIGIDAALRSGVTITGAFDDACACFFGGVIVADNKLRKILTTDSLDDDLIPIIHIPNYKITKNSLPMGKIRAISPIAEIAFDLAGKRKFKEAMILNGLAYSSALGLGTEIAIKALAKGAYSAGLSGTGPATVILAYEDNVEDIISVMDDGQIVQTRLNGQSGL